MCYSLTVGNLYTHFSQIESDHIALAKNRNTLMELQETLVVAGKEITKLKEVLTP